MTTQTKETNKAKLPKVDAAFHAMHELIEEFGWGCHCAPDAYYADIIKVTKKYLDRQPEGYKRTKNAVAASQWKLLAVWFASGRHDLQDDLLRDRPACWQDFGFPAGVVEAVKEDLVKVEAKLATENQP